MQTQNGDWYGGYMDMDNIIWSETKLKKKYICRYNQFPWKVELQSQFPKIRLDIIGAADLCGKRKMSSYERGLKSVDEFPLKWKQVLLKSCIPNTRMLNIFRTFIKKYSPSACIFILTSTSREISQLLSVDW